MFFSIQLKTKKEKKVKNRTNIFIVVSIFFLLSSTSFSQTRLGLFGIGGKIGYIDPAGPENSTLAFGGIIDLGTLTTNLGLEADFVYWSKSYGLLGATTEVSSFSLSVGAKYYFTPEGKKLRPFAGGGLGFSRASVKVQLVIPWTNRTTSASDTDFTAHAVGGLKYALSSSIDGFAELRFSIAGDYDYWGVFFGIIFKFK